MKGANEYAKLFDTGQHGRLYLVVYSHARGPTFRIFVLPKGEDVISNGSSNAPLNNNAVEVYGVVCGNPGWTEEYGWIHKGPWQDDFNTLVEQKKEQIKLKESNKEKDKRKREEKRAKRTEKLLSDY